MTIKKSPRTIKFILPVMTLMIAVIAFFSFKGNPDAPESKAPVVNDKVYEFTGVLTDQTSVQTPSNWHFNASGASCDGLAQPKACSIIVDAAHATGPTLDGSNITITALNDIDASFYRVTQAKDGSYSADVSNKKLNP